MSILSRFAANWQHLLSPLSAVGTVHIVTTIRLRLYNAGLVTSIVLLLPFTIYTLALGVERGTLSGGEIGLILLCGVLLHLPVAGLFVIPFLFQRRRHATAR